MKLDRLIESLVTEKTVKSIYGETIGVEISNIQFDSRNVTDGSLFVAIEGTASDGHDYIEGAIDKGARVIVYQNSQKVKNDVGNVLMIHVNDSSLALAALANSFYGEPSRKMILVGVTGTNGKTTTATLLYRAMRMRGEKAGLLSTVVNYVNDEAVVATHTTPDPLELNALLKRMADNGCTYVFMEVSSHSVAQNRIACLDFDGAIFTNLTRDHIDYHKTMENYLKAKKKFFDGLKKEAWALTNADDKNGKVMLQNCNAERQKTYGTRVKTDFNGKIIEESLDGMVLNMDGREVTVDFIGRFNVQNLLAVYGAEVLMGIDNDEALRIISALHPVNGRFQTMKSPTGYVAIVDYAHTPDALENVTATINEIRDNRKDSRGKLITVIGCGGNRDKGKRPMMAKAAVRASDMVVITSDNPRHERPEDIIKDMTDGLDATDMKNVLVIEDRRMAIKTACSMAKEGDIVLVAGKGHEDYQIIGDKKTHFDDKEEIMNAFGGSCQRKI